MLTMNLTLLKFTNKTEILHANYHEVVRYCVLDEMHSINESFKTLNAEFFAAQATNLMSLKHGGLNEA